jgi:hypothetical protein
LIKILDQDSKEWYELDQNSCLSELLGLSDVDPE